MPLSQYITVGQSKIIEKKHNRHQHNTGDGGQTMGEELIHVQMSG